MRFASLQPLNGTRTGNQWKRILRWCSPTTHMVSPMNVSFNGKIEKSSINGLCSKAILNYTRGFIILASESPQLIKSLTQGGCFFSNHLTYSLAEAISHSYGHGSYGAVDPSDTWPPDPPASGRRPPSVAALWGWPDTRRRRQGAREGLTRLNWWGTIGDIMIS